MTTITINESLNIKWNFNTFFDLFKYINDNIEVEIEELENQDNLLKSKEYDEYNKTLSNIKI